MQGNLFDYADQSAGFGSSNDYHILPPSEKQLSFAAALSAQKGVALPDAAKTDRAALSRWIEKNKSGKIASRFDRYPSSKQVRFAEVIARKKRREVPPECFRDKVMMSRWIDSNR